MSTYVPTIDAALAHLDSAEREPGQHDDVVAAILAVGRDVGIQLGRIADHLTIEAVVAQTGSRFGEVPAGHDPNVATKDPARGHRLSAATPSGPIVS
ncbi:MAG TPA: hypothetical protein VF156_15405 [Agromyces sp.]